MIMRWYRQRVKVIGRSQKVCMILSLKLKNKLSMIADYLIVIHDRYFFNLSIKSHYSIMGAWHNKIVSFCILGPPKGYI